MKWLIRSVALILLAATPALAVLPGEQLSNPALEARARALSSELRCLVCQNQSLDESDAELAHDLRVLLRKRLVAGDTDRQAIDFIVQRYGKFVLLKPPFEADTLLLWLGPFLIVLTGGGMVTYYLRNSRAASQPAFGESEQARLQTLLEGPDRT
ncbi:MAG TPA: cytochrome c-type biogenesis protein [Rhizomicrobium sp.]|jgi:cytochrome c-type biogenesis protein CcmH